MNRRDFLVRAARIAAASFAWTPFARGARPRVRPAGGRLVLGVPLTHSDWMLKPNIASGEPGVRHMLDACKAAGWSRVDWRVCDAGRATYHSKVMRPASHRRRDNIFNPRTDEGRSP